MMEASQTYIHTYVHTHTHTEDIDEHEAFTRQPFCINIRTCTQEGLLFTHTYTHKQVYAHRHTLTARARDTRAPRVYGGFLDIHTYIHTYIHTHTHTHTHTYAVRSSKNGVPVSSLVVALYK